MFRSEDEAEEKEIDGTRRKMRTSTVILPASPPHHHSVRLGIEHEHLFNNVRLDLDDEHVTNVGDCFLSINRRLSGARHQRRKTSSRYRRRFFSGANRQPLWTKTAEEA